MKSIITKILITIAVVLIITDIGLLALGFSTVYATVRRTYVFMLRHRQQWQQIC